MRTYLFVAAIIALTGISFWLLVENNQGLEDPVACTMDARICPDGSAVGRTGPYCEFAECPQVPENKPDVLMVSSPKPNDMVTSPLIVTGEARGNWFFEGSFPIVIVDWDGLIIGEGIATAQGEWMTTEFVPFIATITYSIASTTPRNNGTLILKKDNPSGLPEHDDSREIPIVFGDILP